MSRPGRRCSTPSPVPFSGASSRCSRRRSRPNWRSCRLPRPSSGVSRVAGSCIERDRDSGDGGRPDRRCVHGRVGRLVDGAAMLAAGVARFGANVLVGSAGLVDLAPWLSWRVPPTPIGWTLAYYLACGVLLLPIARGGLRSDRCRSVPLMPGRHRDRAGVERAAPGAGRLRLTVLDVGQGDAIVVQFPSGHSMIVDTGGTAGSFDIGGRVVTPAAWALGVRRLDWLVITHGDRITSAVRRSWLPIWPARDLGGHSGSAKPRVGRAAHRGAAVRPGVANRLARATRWRSAA